MVKKFSFWFPIMCVYEVLCWMKLELKKPSYYLHFEEVFLWLTNEIRFFFLLFCVQLTTSEFFILLTVHLPNFKMHKLKFDTDKLFLLLHNFRLCRFLLKPLIEQRIIGSTKASYCTIFVHYSDLSISALRIDISVCVNEAS